MIIVNSNFQPIRVIAIQQRRMRSVGIRCIFHHELHHAGAIIRTKSGHRIIFVLLLRSIETGCSDLQPVNGLAREMRRHQSDRAVITERNHDVCN